MTKAARLSSVCVFAVICALGAMAIPPVSAASYPHIGSQATSARRSPALSTRSRRARAHHLTYSGGVPSRTAPTVKPAAGLRVTSSMRLMPGTYRLADDGGGTIQITGYDIDLDCRGVRIRGAGSGLGVHIVNARNVTLRGLDVSGFAWGVVVENSSGVVVQSCVSSHNGNLPVATVIPEDGKLPEDTHGGGYLFRDSHHSRLLNSTAEHEWDGLDVVRCQNNTFRGNDLSYLNNWGVHLWSSSHNTVAQNHCVWCSTGEGRTFQGQSGWQTYDAAGILIEHDSSYNLIDTNDLRFGGDGLFIRDNLGPDAPGAVFPRPHPSNHNIVRYNDCSLSPNNAIEADFCDDNVFDRNNCSSSNYGFWLGYSRRATVSGNAVVGCTARGIQIENGQNDRISGNTFINSVRRPDQSLVFLYQNGRDHTPSGPYVISQNVFVGSTRPVELSHTAVKAAGNRLIVTSAQIFSADRFSTVTDGGEDTGSGGLAPIVERITPDPAPVGAGLPSPVIPETLDVASGRRSHASSRIRLPVTQGPPQNTIVTIVGRRLSSTVGPPIVQIEGATATVLRADPGLVEVMLPYDFWDRPAPRSARLKVFNGESSGPAVPLKITWTSSKPQVEAITPAQILPGAEVMITGDHLLGPNGAPPVVLRDGVPVKLSAATDTAVTFSAPGKLLSSRGYNLLLTARSESYPITLNVTAPRDWEPHIVSARISPDRLHAGDLLHVEMVVKNNAPFTLAAADPPGGTIYDEADSYESRHFSEQAGSVYLRVTSDLKGGSWPYLWGLSTNLPPGESETVDGYIRVETPGAVTYKVGLVDGLVRWIDDGVYPTSVTVTPKE